MIAEQSPLHSSHRCGLQMAQGAGVSRSSQLILIQYRKGTSLLLQRLREASVSGTVSVVALPKSFGFSFMCSTPISFLVKVQHCLLGFVLLLFLGYILTLISCAYLDLSFCSQSLSRVTMTIFSPPKYPTKCWWPQFC